jgi:hypothetical protein
MIFVSIVGLSPALELQGLKMFCSLMDTMKVNIFRTGRQDREESAEISPSHRASG